MSLLVTITVIKSSCTCAKRGSALVIKVGMVYMKVCVLKHFKGRGHGKIYAEFVV